MVYAVGSVVGFYFSCCSRSQQLGGVYCFSSEEVQTSWVRTYHIAFTVWATTSCTGTISLQKSIFKGYIIVVLLMRYVLPGAHLVERDSLHTRSIRQQNMHVDDMYLR